MEWVELIFVKVPGVLLSWPVMVGLVAYFFMKSFKDEVKQFLRTGRVRVGNTELQAQAPSAPNDEVERLRTERDQKDRELKTAYGVLGEMAQTTGANQTQITQLQEAIEFISQLATDWRFKYLNIFLVPQTKLVLSLLRFLGSIPYEKYHETISPYVQNIFHREVILGTLVAEGLVSTIGDNLIVSEDGEKFDDYQRQNPWPPPEPGHPTVDSGLAPPAS